MTAPAEPTLDELIAEIEANLQSYGHNGSISVDSEYAVKIIASLKRLKERDAADQAMKEHRDAD